jgi:hypothetical protein
MFLRCKVYGYLQNELRSPSVYCTRVRIGTKHARHPCFSRVNAIARLGIYAVAAYRDNKPYVVLLAHGMIPQDGKETTGKRDTVLKNNRR